MFQMVKEAFLCVCRSVSLSVKHFKNDIGMCCRLLMIRVFIMSDKAESLFLSRLISFAPSVLLLVRISNAVNNSSCSLCRCLSRIRY